MRNKSSRRKSSRRKSSKRKSPRRKSLVGGMLRRSNALSCCNKACPVSEGMYNVYCHNCSTSGAILTKAWRDRLDRKERDRKNVAMITALTYSGMLPGDLPGNFTQMASRLNPLIRRPPAVPYNYDREVNKQREDEMRRSRKRGRD